MKLQNVLDFAAATGLHQSMLGELKAAGRLQIDASGVEVISTSCMQVVVAATREGAVVVNPSPAFTEAFETLALDLAGAIAFRSEPDVAEEPVPAPMSDLVEVAIDDGQSTARRADEVPLLETAQRFGHARPTNAEHLGHAVVRELDAR